MIETLTIASFEDKIGHTFRIEAEADHTIDTRLVDAKVLTNKTADGAPRVSVRDPFSLLFQGPGTPRLAQQIYRVSHDTLGAHDIFLVPVGVRDGGLLYEAIFT
jgi:hypothetical protein